MIRRPIHANTSWDQARLEVAGHRFCDLSEASFGVSVLTDYKYGYTVRDQTIGLSLLKAGEFPWDGTDKKQHRFTYSLMCHEEPLGHLACKVTEEAHKLSQTVHAFRLAAEEKQKIDEKLFELDGDVSWTLTAFKKAERSGAHVLRFAE